VLAPFGRFRAGVNPIAATVSPMGRFLYVANQGSDDITLLLIHPHSGMLTVSQTASAGVAPSASAVATEFE
jgi:6-phosphogluconolactonase (cycloisomerase 2 family)